MPGHVVGEVDVVIDERAADARASYAPSGAAPQGITYIGTPSGLKSLIEDVYAAEVADAVRVLYGGSVKSGNVASIMAGADVDGALVGGASLQAEEFAAICRYQQHLTA